MLDKIKDVIRRLLGLKKKVLVGRVLKEQDIYRGYKNKRYADKAIEFLTKRHLLPLTGFSSLSNLVGHLMGDGTLSKDKFVGDFRFYGSKEKLEYIKNIVDL